MNGGSQKKLSSQFTASLTGSTNIAGIFAGAAAAMTSALNPAPFMPADFGKPLTELVRQKPLTQEQADAVLTKAFDTRLDPDTYGPQQLFAARFYLRAEMDGLPGITQTLLKKHDSPRVMDEVLERMEIVMARPAFAQLMAEHSAEARRKQDASYARKVGAVMGGSHAAVKAPPRARFTRKVTA